MKKSQINMEDLTNLSIKELEEKISEINIEELHKQNGYYYYNEKPRVGIENMHRITTSVYCIQRKELDAFKQYIREKYNSKMSLAKQVRQGVKLVDKYDVNTLLYKGEQIQRQLEEIGASQTESLSVCLRSGTLDVLRRKNRRLQELYGEKGVKPFAFFIKIGLYEFISKNRSERAEMLIMDSKIN